MECQFKLNTYFHARTKMGKVKCGLYIFSKPLFYVPTKI